MIRNISRRLMPGSQIFRIGLLVLVLSACNSRLPALTVSPTRGTTEAELQPSATATTVVPEITPTATEPPQPGLAVLVIPPGSDQESASGLYEGLKPRFIELGLRWETRTDLTTADLAGSGIRLILILPTSRSSLDQDIAALAASATQVQFLAVGIPGLQPTSNLSLIGEEGLHMDRQGFIAGVIAAMITPDWRVGVLGPSEPEQALQARQGFLNGAVYFCGLCLPYHGPTNIDYPIYWDLPAGAQADEVQAALQGLENLAVKTVYLPPGVLNAEMTAQLAGSGLQIIGSGTPPADLADDWVVSINVDLLPSILEMLPGLLEGQGGQTLDPDISLQNINPERFSPGRQTRALEILADLQAGYVDPGLDLLEP